MRGDCTYENKGKGDLQVHLTARRPSNKRAIGRYEGCRWCEVKEEGGRDQGQACTKECGHAVITRPGELGSGRRTDIRSTPAQHQRCNFCCSWPWGESTLGTSRDGRGPTRRETLAQTCSHLGSLQLLPASQCSMYSASCDSTVALAPTIQSPGCHARARGESRVARF
ncbi:hypothetical protein Micbo1qcDRAFT_165946, partial [Microdochium bolleyi]